VRHGILRSVSLKSADKGLSPGTNLASFRRDLEKLKIFGCEISIFLNSTNFSVPRY
jgi:hypothetical protein